MSRCARPCGSRSWPRLRASARLRFGGFLASRAALLARRVSSIHPHDSLFGPDLRRVTQSHASPPRSSETRFARCAICAARTVSRAEIRKRIQGAARGRLVPGDDRELVGQGGELRPRRTAARWRHARTHGGPSGSHEEEPLRPLCAALVGLARGGTSGTTDESAPSLVARPEDATAATEHGLVADCRVPTVPEGATPLDCTSAARAEAATKAGLVRRLLGAWATGERAPSWNVVLLSVSGRQRSLQDGPRCGARASRTTRTWRGIALLAIVVAVVAGPRPRSAQ